MITSILILVFIISLFIFLFIKRKSLIIAFNFKKPKEYIGDIAVNCLKDNELISIVSNGDRTPKDRELADKEIRRRKIKLQY